MGDIMSQTMFIEEVDILFEDELKGTANVKLTEKEVLLVLPVLKALGILVVLENGDVEIKKFVIE